MTDKLTAAINALNNKGSKFYIHVPDTNGTVTAGAKYLYDVAAHLVSTNHKAYLLHEADNYQRLPLSGHEGLEFVSFAKMSTDKAHLLSAADFIFISELYVESIMAQMIKSKLPCKFIVVSQAYDYIFHHLEVGISWESYGITDCLTTSLEQAEFINDHMNLVDCAVVPPFVGDEFKKSVLPKKPYVAMVSRFPSDGDKIIKQFFLKHPLFAWVPFKALGNLAPADFARELSECCAAVWVDEPSSFGTFPLEAMKCGVPVVGVVPSMVPGWMVEGGSLRKNGTWCANRLSVVDAIALEVDSFLHNTTDPNRIALGQETAAKYTKETFSQQMAAFVEKITQKRIQEITNLIQKYENSNPGAQNPE